MRGHFRSRSDTRICCGQNLTAIIRNLLLMDYQLEELRFVQLTPPGSGCSIAIGEGLTEAEPGSVKGLQLVVNDIEAARAELAGRGVEVSDIQRFPWGAFVFFKDPDGNGWSVQEIPPREA